MRTTRREMLIGGAAAMLSPIVGAEPKKTMLGGEGAELIPSDNLPYDAEVSYLQSSGTQYIKVGQVIGEVTSIEVVLSPSELPSSGAYKAFSVGYNINFGDDAGVNSIGWCGSSVVQCETDKLVTLRYDANGRYVDGAYIGGYGSAFINKLTSGGNLFLFCGSNGTNAYITGSGNYMAWRGWIRSCEVMAHDEKLVDMIAVRFTNESGESEGAMYDRVSGELFVNSGTGNFLIGPDL